jgi:hypothetical protein
LPIGNFSYRYLNYILALLLTIGGDRGMKGSPAFSNGESRTGSRFGCAIIYTSDYL